MAVDTNLQIRRSNQGGHAVPPLESGDRLSRAEFERRYEAHPEIKKAELIEGVVCVSSPVRHVQHGRPHALIMLGLGSYVAATPGVDISDNATVRLDFENEEQPDALLRLEPGQGGMSRISDDGYIEGPPELIVEVAASSAAVDMNDRRRAYGRNGVREYLVIQVYEQRVDWFALREGVYEALAPDAAGRLHSQVFPGLRLQPAALWAGDAAAPWRRCGAASARRSTRHLCGVWLVARRRRRCKNERSHPVRFEQRNSRTARLFRCAPVQGFQMHTFAVIRDCSLKVPVELP